MPPITCPFKGELIKRLKGIFRARNHGEWWKWNDSEHLLFRWIAEYKIPGTASPLGACDFTYLSTSQKNGEFNSPRYPSRYPSNITCTYNFEAAPNESTKLYFDQFKVRANGTTITYGLAVEDCLDGLLPAKALTVETAGPSYISIQRPALWIDRRCVMNWYEAEGQLTFSPLQAIGS